MKSAIAIAAVAGLATIASAQNVGTVTLTSSATTVNSGDVFTIGVVLSDNISGNSVFSFDLSIGGAGDYNAAAPTGDAGVFGFAGGSDGSTVTGLGGASDILGPTLDPSLDGVTVMTFQVTAGAAGTIDFTAAAGAVNAAMSFGIEGGIVILPGAYDSIDLGSVSVNVVPAPSGMALLGLGGLVAARRRR